MYYMFQKIRDIFCFVFPPIQTPLLAPPTKIFWSQPKVDSDSCIAGGFHPSMFFD